MQRFRKQWAACGCHKACLPTLRAHRCSFFWGPLYWAKFICVWSLFSACSKVFFEGNWASLQMQSWSCPALGNRGAGEAADGRVKASPLTHTVQLILYIWTIHSICRHIQLHVTGWVHTIHSHTHSTLHVATENVGIGKAQTWEQCPFIIIGMCVLANKPGNLRKNIIFPNCKQVFFCAKT